MLSTKVPHYTIEVQDDMVIARWIGGKMAAMSDNNTRTTPNPICDGACVAAKLTDGTIINTVYGLRTSSMIPETLRVFCTDFTGHYNYLKSLATNSNVIFGKPLKIQASENKDYPHICPKCGAPAYIGLSAVECSKNCC